MDEYGDMPQAVREACERYEKAYAMLDMVEGEEAFNVYWHELQAARIARDLAIREYREQFVTQRGA